MNTPCGILSCERLSNWTSWLILYPLPVPYSNTPAIIQPCGAIVGCSFTFSHLSSTFCFLSSASTCIPLHPSEGLIAYVIIIFLNVYYVFQGTQGHFTHSEADKTIYVMSLNICAALGEVRHAKTVQNVPLCTP